MLFVDDDDAEVFKRGKQRGAGADHNGRFAVFRLQPGRETFAVIEPGVQDFHRRVKALAKTGDGLRRQADLWHHHQRLAPLRQHILQHAQIHFRFPGAGNTRQQPGGEAIGGAVDRADGGGLLGIKTQAFASHRIRAAPVGEGGRFAGQLRQPFAAQRLQRRFIKFQFADLMTPDFALAQRRQRLLLLRRAFQTVKVDGLPLLGGEPVPQRRSAGGFALAQQNGQRMEQHIADRVMVVLSRPHQQPPDGTGEDRFVVQRFRDRF